MLISIIDQYVRRETILTEIQEKIIKNLPNVNINQHQRLVVVFHEYGYKNVLPQS